MSLPIKVFSAVLILGCAGLFVLKKPDGTPILSANEFLPDINALVADAKKLIANAKNSTSSIGNSLANNPEKNTQENTEKTAQAQPNIYRWRDSDGQWQFSDTPPANQAAEAMNVSGNLNKDLVATYEPPKEPETENAATSNNSSATNLTPMTVSPEKISKLIEDANNIQKLVDDRAEQMKQY
jgi:hypothetical protein